MPSRTEKARRMYAKYGGIWKKLPYSSVRPCSRAVTSLTSIFAAPPPPAHCE